MGNRSTVEKRGEKEKEQVIEEDPNAQIRSTVEKRAEKEREQVIEEDPNAQIIEQLDNNSLSPEEYINLLEQAFSHLSHETEPGITPIHNNSMTERGQSAEVYPCQIQDCMICMEPKYPYENFVVKGCFHTFCLDCIRSHITVKIEQNVTTIICPIFNCEGEIKIESCGLILPPEVLDSWNRLLCESSEEVCPCPTQHCTICMDPKYQHENFVLQGCFHSFCLDCIRGHIKAKIEENVTTVRCPELSCEEEIKIEFCGLILPPEVLDMWGRLLCESAIQGPTMLYCPFKDCSAPLTLDDADNGEPITESKCPHCNRLICARCKVPWHLDIGCAEFQKLRVDDRQREDIMLVKLAHEKKWQRCPSCGQVVERTHGCLFVKCRCRYCFCYKCGGKMDAKDSRHYCSNCKSTW